MKEGVQMGQDYRGEEARAALPAGEGPCASRAALLSRRGWGTVNIPLHFEDCTPPHYLLPTLPKL